jgi:ATP-binding cassette subfamily F protein 3
VLEHVDLSLRAGARIGLLGPNGAGKSTLVASLAGELPLIDGRRIEGQGLAIGYFAQHQLEQLDPEESPLWHLARDEPDARSQDLRSYLGHFDFGGDKADAAVGTCSGGERSRLALARLVRRRPNLLLLDEPTNHLDLEMRHALTRALTAYEGSVILVSHDRALLRTVCDEFLIVADGRVERFDGGIEDYLDWLNARRDGKRSAAEDSGLAQARAERREARAEREARRQAWLRQRRPLLRELEQLECALPRLEQEKSALESRLADTSFYASASPDEQRATIRRCTELTEQLRLAEERWLELQEQIEALGEA